jgi:hypothetical protein
MLTNTQNNPNWANQRLGNSSCTMAGYGCTTTAYANGVGKRPDKVLEFAKYTQGGLIIWQSLPGFQVRYRQYDRARIREVAKDTNRFIILEVINRNSPTSRHWVTLESLGWGGYNCVDPWNPRDKWNALKNFYNIFQVLGHAEFTK